METAQKKMSFLTSIGILVGVVVVGALVIYAMLPDLRPDRGIFAINLSNGSRVYFKREVRGLTYDRLFLTTNPDPCKPESSEFDHIFHEIGPLTVYYRSEGPALEVYSASPLEKPTRDTFPVKIIFHELEPLESREMRKSYKAQGLAKLDVVARLKCP